MSTPSAPQIIYDRVKIYLPNGEYLPNGFVRNFNIGYHTANSQVSGLNTTGAPVAQVWGNNSITVRWDEWIGSNAQWFNWTAFLLATPDVLLTVLPFSINANAPIAPQFTITGLLISGSEAHFGGDSQPGMRPCTFTAATSSLFSY